MQVDGAIIREQGVTFAVVVVKKHIVDNVIEAKKALQSFAPAFGGLPIVLMSQDRRGTPSYFGPRNIANFLANLPSNRIPWRRYTLS